MKSIQNFENFALNNEQESQTTGGLSGKMERLLRRRKINRRLRLEAQEAAANQELDYGTLIECQVDCPMEPFYETECIDCGVGIIQM